jgi:uncharacterized protein YdeI (YjbR/CyaY-like superfamily)
MKQPLPAQKLLDASSRSQWRAWLRKNYKTETEIWLVYYKKHTGRPRISYNDAVEEALCFGWIDSRVRAIDENKFAQKFSVRRRRSKYSQANLERLRALVRQGKVAKDVLRSLPDLSRETLSIPADILKAVKANKQAWKNYQRFSESYVRIRVAYIDAARKRPVEFEKRLSHFVRMTEENKQFGFGGIEKHY